MLTVSIFKSKMGYSVPALWLYIEIYVESNFFTSSVLLFSIWGENIRAFFPVGDIQGNFLFPIALQDKIKRQKFSLKNAFS